MSAYLYGCLAVIGGFLLCTVILVVLIAGAPQGEEDEKGYHAKE